MRISVLHYSVLCYSKFDFTLHKDIQIEFGADLQQRQQIGTKLKAAFRVECIQKTSARSRETSPAYEILGTSFSQTKKLPQNTDKSWDRVRLLCFEINNQEQKDKSRIFWRRGACASRKGPENHRGSDPGEFKLARFQSRKMADHMPIAWTVCVCSRSKQEADLANPHPQKKNPDRKKRTTQNHPENSTNQTNYTNYENKTHTTTNHDDKKHTIEIEWIWFERSGGRRCLFLLLSKYEYIYSQSRRLPG